MSHPYVNARAVARQGMAAKIAGMAVPQMQRRAEAVMEKVVHLGMITNNICGAGPLIENNCPTKLGGRWASSLPCDGDHSGELCTSKLACQAAALRPPGCLPRPQQSSPLRNCQDAADLHRHGLPAIFVFRFQPNSLPAGDIQHKHRRHVPNPFDLMRKLMACLCIVFL